MLSFGWPELFLIIVVAAILIGPKEIPVLMVGLGRIFRRFQYVKFALSQQFEDIMRESDLDDLRKSINFEAEARKEADVDVDYDEAEADEVFAILNASAAEGEEEDREQS